MTEQIRDILYRIITAASKAELYKVQGDVDTAFANGEISYRDHDLLWGMIVRELNMKED